MTERETLMYCAGLFDGEGSACISKKKQSRKNKMYFDAMPYISLTMTDKTPVEIFAKFCCGKVYPLYHKNNGDRIYYAFMVNGRKAGEIAKLLLPYSQIERKRQALKCVIKFSETIGPIGTNTRLAPDLRQLRFSLYQKCQSFNRQIPHSINELEKIVNYGEQSGQLSFL